MTRKSIINFVCAALLAVVLVLQFTPFWAVGDEGPSVSIGDYIWNASHHSKLEKTIKGELGNTYTNAEILAPVIILQASAILGVVLGVWKHDRTCPAFFAVVCGAAGLFAYLTRPVMQLGSGWMLHAAVLALALCAGLVRYVLHFMKK